LSYGDALSFVATTIGIVAVVTMALLAFFVRVSFAPVLRLRILPRWSDDTKNFVILRLEVENISRVRVQKQQIRIQALRHKLEMGGLLSEWVPFSRDDIRDEQPLEWREPVEIFNTTNHIYPGEVLSVERMYHCEQDTALHVGLQVKAKLGRFSRLATRIRSWNQQWTTTCIVLR
jgi:hypothetical protein